MIPLARRKCGNCIHFYLLGEDDGDVIGSCLLHPPVFIGSNAEDANKWDNWQQPTVRDDARCSQWADPNPPPATPPRAGGPPRPVNLPPAMRNPQ